jgi:hypothetical protein
VPEKNSTQKAKHSTHTQTYPREQVRSPRMEAASFNSTILLDEARAELTELLESIRSEKYLVWEAQLGEFLNQILIGSSKLLKDNGVIKVKELKGDQDNLEMPNSLPDVVYIVRPNLGLMKTIARQVRSIIDSKCLKEKSSAVDSPCLIEHCSFPQTTEVSATYSLFLNGLSPVNRYSKTKAC